MSEAAAVGQNGPLALICGGGTLPLAVADIVSARGRKVLLFPLQGIARAEDYAKRPHIWLRIAKFDTFARAARAAGCSEMVLIGSLVRPSFWQMRFDLTTLLLLPRIAAAFKGGDDYLLSRVARLIEQQGFRVLGAHEVAPEILVPEGTLGSVRPSESDHADIALGLDYLRATGAFDVGSGSGCGGQACACGRGGGRYGSDACAHGRNAAQRPGAHACRQRRVGESAKARPGSTLRSAIDRSADR